MFRFRRAVQRSVEDKSVVQSRIRAKRLARISFGVVLFVGFFAAVVSSLLAPKVHIVEAFGAMWGLAILGYFVARFVPSKSVIQGALLRGRGAPIAHLSGDAPNIEMPSLAVSLSVPLAAIALVGPLSLHALAGLMVGDAIEGEWVLISMIVVGHVHVVALICGWWAGRALASGKSALVCWSISIGACFGASLLVFWLLFLPPILVAVSGSIVFGLAYAWASLVLSGERVALDGV